jgi:hypothetical protein
MLRLFVLVLLLLNVGYFAWGQGWLLPYGWGAMQQREPQRLGQQLRPDALVILTREAAAAASEAAASAASPPRDAASCWQSGVLDEAQANAVRTVLTVQLASEAGVLDEVMQPERWMVYMGKFANAADLEKKRTQLSTMKVKVETLTQAPLGPGLSLGSYDSQEAATAALKALVTRGVRTARLMQYPPTTPGYRLRLPALGNEQAAALSQIKAVLPENSLQPCAPQ